MWRVSLIFGVAWTISHASLDVLETFTSPIFSSTAHFTNLAVDRNTDRIYIGAVNRIYQLSSDFKVGQWIVTGPVNDSVECDLNCSANIIKKPTDNVNKVLLIDIDAGRLITCGSVFQGLCSVRDLYNISHDVHEVQEPVVANDAISSTEAFIAPGPPNPPMTKVMYVGVTYTGNSPHRFKVPAVSSRSLENERLFTIASKTAATEIFVNPLSRENYPINYVYGFSSDGFSYFLTTQLSEGLDVFTYYSKLVRVCHNDENYYSYTEIPITCGSEGMAGGIHIYNLAQAAFVGKVGSNLANDLGVTTQDEVLFVAFSQSESLTNNKPSNLSAVCVYPLSMIRQKFLQNIKTCFAGNGTRGLDFIINSTACINTNESLIREDFCGLNVNTPLGGNIPVEAEPVVRLSTKLTAVAASATDNYTVIFAGTADGHLKKIVVENAFSSSEYKDIIIEEGSEVNKDLLFDSKFEHLYVLTERKVSKVKVHECSKHESCLTCLGAKDPYCGWCSYDNQCSLRSACSNALESTYWNSYHSNHCLIISQVVPHQLQRTTIKTLDLMVDSLPSLDNQLECQFKFSNSVLFTNASIKLSEVNCETPRINLLPSISDGQHSFVSKLSLRSISAASEAIDFTFFDCSTYNSCTECVNTSFPCQWCLDGNRCTYDTYNDCRNDIIITSVSQDSPSYRYGPRFCPKIRSVNSASSEILVPFGEKKAITVNTEIIGQFIVQTRFLCKFVIEGQVHNVNAQLLGNKIYCDAFEFTYTSNTSSLIASFNVVWASSKTLDNRDGIYILIYRCEKMANRCSKCLNLPEKFGCGWCQESSSCEHQKKCIAPSIWLNSNESC